MNELIKVIGSAAMIEGSIRQVMEDLAKAVRCSKESMISVGIPERFADQFITDAVRVGLDTKKPKSEKEEAQRVVAEIMASYSKILEEEFGR